MSWTHIFSKSIEFSNIRSISCSTAGTSRRSTASATANSESDTASPALCRTCSRVIFSARDALLSCSPERALERQTSSSESASRIPPSARLAMRSAASGSIWMPSCSQTHRTRAAMTEGLMRRKSNRWQRERMVAGILCTSVVARMKMHVLGRLLHDFEQGVERPDR